MLDLLFITSLVSNCVGGIKRAFEPTISAEDRANEAQITRDIIKGVPYEQIKKDIRNGKYRLAEPQAKVKYPEPHRDPVNGKIIIENYTLYYQDLAKFSGYQVMEWAKQGKYNLTPEELEKEHNKYKEEQEVLSKKYANRKFKNF